MTTKSPESHPARALIDAATEQVDKALDYFDAKTLARMRVLAAHLRGEDPDEEPITTTRPLPALPPEPQHRL